MRIVAWVLNDVTRDSRVLREAATLAAAGHEVTVMGTTRSVDEAAGSVEERDGFRIVRVPLPRRSARWNSWVRAPWRGVTQDLRGAARAISARPPRPGEALRQAASGIVSLPWVVLRAAWVAVVNKTLRRPVTVGGLDYLVHWRTRILGWGSEAMRQAPRADVHHAHDLEALPSALKAAARDGARVVYDSHEIFVQMGSLLDQPRWVRWALARWERRMAGRAAALVTVNDSIAGILRQRLGVARIVVVHNCPARWAQPMMPPDHLRRTTGIPADSPLVLYHGGFMHNRGLEQTALAMLEPGLEKAHLVFMGHPVAYLESILADPRLAGRAHHVPPVAPGDVVEWVSGADVDVMAIQPVGQNSLMSTPNKLFESIAAGVPVVSSDFPARRRIVLDDPAGPLGAVCDPTDPGAIARALRSILDLPPEARAELRGRCLRVAHERWNWETEGERLVALYAELAASA